jgi:hypothetical protein
VRRDPPSGASGADVRQPLGDRGLQVSAACKAPARDGGDASACPLDLRLGRDVERRPQIRGILGSLAIVALADQGHDLYAVALSRTSLMIV